MINKKGFINLKDAILIGIGFIIGYVSAGVVLILK